MNRSKTLITALILGVTAACADQTPTAAPASPDGTAPTALLSRGIALALQDAPRREALRDAFRESPLTEHKLILQDFVGTPRGAALVRTAAARLGVPESELRAGIAGLPRMDLYVPGREDRLAWQAEGNVAVFATVERSDDLTGYTPAGAAVRAPRSLSGTDVVEIVFHPAESSSYRIDPQARVPGRVIQDPTDGEFGVRMQRLDLFGNVLETVDLGREQATTGRIGPRFASYEDNLKYCQNSWEDLDIGCQLKDTYSLGLRAHTDDGYGVYGSLEIIYKVYFSVNMGSSSASTTEQQVWNIDGVPPFQWLDLRTRSDARFGLRILNNTPVNGGCFTWPTSGCQGDEVSISVREDDGVQGQDRYGNAVFYANENGYVRATTSDLVEVIAAWRSPLPALPF